MEDFRLDIQIRNNRIISLIESLGYPNITHFCKACGIPRGAVDDFVNLRLSPLNQAGGWRAPALALASALHTHVSDLWSDEQLYMELATNRGSCEVSTATLAGLQQSVPLEQLVFDEQVNATVDHALNALSPRYARVLRMRFGLPPHDRTYTLDEVGKEFGITRERVRQIETRAIRKLRNGRSFPGLRAISDQLDEAI